MDVSGIRATRWGRYLAAIVLAGLLALALPPAPRRASGFRSSGPYTPSHAALVAAESGRRPVEGRLSGGFAFAPWDEGLLDGPAEPSAGNLATEAAIEAASVGDPDASSRAARAILEVRRGRPDAAIVLLTAAVEERPHDPRLLSDLAAAYLERARRLPDPRSLVSALAATDRALALDERFPEAAFNRALALERLHLTHGATAAWERVVDLDPASGWAEEARQRFARLRAAPPAAERWQAAREELSAAAHAGDRQTVRRLVERYRQPVRQWVDDELLGAWAEAAGTEPAEAATALATARLLATALGEVTGDRLTADAVAAVDRARGRQRPRLIEGHRRYREARRLHEELRYEEAEPAYARAAAELAAGDSPFAAWPRLYQATLIYHRPDLPMALSLLVEQRRSLDIERYPVLGGYIHWVLALVRGRFGPLAAAFEDCEASRRLFQRAGEVENLAHMESMVARVYGEQGDLNQAWRYHEAAFAARPWLRNPRHVENLVFNAVATLRSAGELGPALAFADEMVAEAALAGSPLGIAVTGRQRGELLADLERTEEALGSFEDAWRSSDEVPDEGLRRVVQGEILIARGRTRCALDPPAALADLEQADRFVTGTQHRHRRIEILREQARCHLARGDRAGAAAALDEGLAEVNRQRALLEDSALRRAYLDESRALLEEWVHFRLEMDEGPAALDTVERLRSPVLLEAMGAAASSSDLGAAIDALPERATLLEFLALPEELVVWVVDRSGVEVVRVPVARADLGRRIDAFVRSLIQGEPPRDRALERTLLAGLLPLFDRTSTLIVVPDGPLHALPFGALRYPASGRYLAERFAIATAPGARGYAALAGRARERSAGRPSSVLAVGGVPFEPRLFAGLPALPRSEQEARRVAALYPKATRLLGAAATPGRFLAEVPRHDVIHLATHGLTFSGEPDLSSLVLAPASGGAGDGLLPAGEIRFEQPVTTRLVVLAACRSLQGTVSATEGPLSLARPFLAAGVPAVIGSLWDLDEATSLSFFSRFHAAHAAGSDPLTAFHETQLALLNDPDPRLSSPRSWAGLVYLGATAGSLPPQMSLALPGSEPRKESSP